MHQVRYFLAVAEALNFTRAAERCNVSQPALTRAIQGLEAEFGGPLFRRERNNTHLTELGRTVLPYLSTVWEQTEAARSKAKDFGRLLDVPLKVGIMCTIGPTRLLGLMSAFHANNPGVDIHLTDARAQVLNESLLSGELDVALFALPGPLDERLHALRLFDETFCIAAPPGHRFERMQAVPLVDMNKERYLSRANCEFAQHIDAIYDEKGIDIRLAYRSERDDWIQSMVLAGLGVTTIPEFAITVPGLVVRQMVDPIVIRTVNLATVRGRPHSPAVGALVREAMRYDWMRV